MKIIFATKNKSKLEEVNNVFSDLKNVDIMDMEEAGISDDIVEDGRTLKENALKKARFVAEKTGEWTFADDTGLCIKALDNKPGVYSSRWAGDWASGREKAEFALMKMKDIPSEKREAFFKTVAVLISPEGREWIFEGVIRGVILEEIRGEVDDHVPYDSVFMPKGYSKTFSELDDSIKYEKSHRAIAFSKLKDFIKNSYGSRRE